MARVKPSADLDHIERFLEMLVAERMLARNTCLAYRHDLVSVSCWLGGHKSRRLGTASSQDLRDYVIFAARRGMSARTTARHLSALRHYYRFLVEESLRGDNPTIMIESPRLTRSLPKILSVKDINDMIDAAAKMPGIHGQRLTALLEILYATGMRVSELVALPVSALSRKLDYVRVRGKGGRERMLPLGEAAQRSLAVYLKAQKKWDQKQDTRKQHGPQTAFLFPSPKACGHLSRQHFARMLKEVARRAGIEPGRVSPHVWRHALATHLTEGGMDLRSLQQLLGHADIATTQIYTHLTSRHLRKLVETHHPMAQSASLTGQER